MTVSHLLDFFSSLDDGYEDNDICLFVDASDGKSRLKKAYFITESNGDDFFLLTDKDIFKEVKKCEDADTAVE